jgi:uncharacterized alkaline shock family protein YloU
VLFRSVPTHAHGERSAARVRARNYEHRHTVVSKIAGIAAREVRGVYDLGGGTARALGGVTQRVGHGDERTQGVSVEVGEREAAVDLTAVIEYGRDDRPPAEEPRVS